MQKHHEVLNFFKSNHRNKLIISIDSIPDLCYINLGKTFAQKIEHFALDRKFSVRANEALDECLNDSIQATTFAKETLALENVGIILEPDLKIDFLSLIERYSKHCALFIKWNGEIDENYLYFLTKANGLKFNIKHISHIKI